MCGHYVRSIGGQVMEDDMKHGRIVLPALIFSWLAICATGAAATECTRANQRMCDPRSNMEMICTETAKNIFVPINTGKPCPPVLGQKSCGESAREFQQQVDAFNVKCTGARSVSQAALYNWCAGEKTRLAQIQTQTCARCGGCR